MKNFFLFILFLSCLSANSLIYVDRPYTFDFSAPDLLSPAVSNIGSSVGDSREIGGWVFSSDDGMLTMSMDMGSSLIAPRVVRGANGTTNLQMPRFVSMVISVSEGSRITGLRIPGIDNIGGLRLQDTNPESIKDMTYFTLNSDQSSYEWPLTAEGNSMSLNQDCYSLTLLNAAPSPTAIHSVTVIYRVELLDFSLSLPSGKVEKIPSELTMTFDEAIGSVDNSIVAEVTDETGAVVGKATPSFVDANHVKLQLEKPITENGIYTLVIPTKMVKSTVGNHFNTSKTFTFTIGNLASEQTKAKARMLLAKTGVGYPTESSAARQALMSLGPKASEEDYLNAINDYLSTTEVEMPADGKYYHIIAVGKDGATAYVQYVNGTVGLTKAAVGAVALKATASGSAFTFATPDGQGLTQLGASASGVSATATPLTFAKIAGIDGATNEELFGLFSIYGNVGTSATYALVNVDSPMFMTDVAITTLFFNSRMTSAFKLEETLAPDAPEPVTDDISYDFIDRVRLYYKEDPGITTPVKDTFLNTMTLFSYDSKIGVSDKEVVLINFNTNTEVTRGKFVVVDSDPDVPSARGIIKLKLNKEIVSGSLPAGQYCYQIFDGTFGDENFAQYSADPAAFLASGKKKSDCHANSYLYYILQVNNNNTPTPDPDTPSDAVMAKARAALAKSGIGYPVANAQTRTVLQNLVNGGTGTDEEFNKAIQAYYAETNIQLPTQGKWYKIFAVSAENSIAYVQTTGTLTSSKSEAGAFKVGTSDNTLTFSTIDGQYLTVLTKDGSFTNSYASAENNLAVARFPVTVGNVESTFGKMIISGTKNGSAMVSQVNAKTMTITTSGNTAVYNNDVTSAFQFEETDEPQAEPTPEIEYALSPESGQQISETGAEVTLTFKNENISNVIVADQNKIKLKKDAEVKSVTVSKQDDKVFVIKFGDLAPGTYTLLIEQGAFTFTFKNRVETVTEIKATYTVPEKAVPSQEMVDKVKALLALTGIGYPKADSPARVALEELLKKNEGSDEVFQAALDAYYAEDDIELPVAGKYYRLKISNSSNIKYVALKSAAEDNTLALENAADNAAPFELKANADGTVTLVTVNDKYLTLPQPGACLSLTYDKAKHDLRLSRLSVADVSAEQTFGLMSVSLGGKYAVIGVFGLASYKDPADAPAYDKVKTSAFTFEEVDVSGIEMPDLTYSVTPETNAKVDVLDKFTITFLTSKKVTLADAGKIMLVSGYNGTKLYDVKSVKEVAGAKPNTFAIEFSKVKSGVYDLIIDEGAFKVSFLGRSESVQKIEVKGIFAQKDNEKDDDVIVGDVNGDGAVDVADISAIINVMAGMANWPDADVNGDGTVDVADISRVIIIMANGQD